MSPRKWRTEKVGGLAKKPRRKPGTRWRLKANDDLGGQALGAGYNVASFPLTKYLDIEESLPADLRSRYFDASGTVFDELVVDDWFHLEAMTSSVWWMNVGGVTLHVTVTRDGKPKDVSVHMPGEYDLAREGCAYLLNSEDYDTPATRTTERNGSRERPVARMAGQED